MDGTRKGIRGEIKAWIKNPAAHRICWLTGKAGSGKTSIAKTVCEQASKDSEMMLGGSFFCSRSTGLAAQRDIRCVVPTLTQLLALKSTEFRLALAATIEPSDQFKEVAAQVEQLLRTPLSTLRDVRVPILFVIDALDECGGDTTDGMLDDVKSHGIVTNMLEALVSLTRSDSRLPVKFLVTSRPEAQIRDTSISNDEHSQILRLHTVSSEEVDADIRLYITKTLDAKLSGKPQRRNMMTDGDIKDLVRLCDGLFIVAATAVEHVFSEGTDAAVSNFKKLINDSREGLNDSAADPLDRMYEIILEAAVGKTVAKMTGLQRLLASVLSARMTLSIAALGELLGLESYDVSARLTRLHSVVHVPDGDDVPGLRTVHASFGDYLFSRAPSHIRIPQSLGHDTLAHGCLDLMEKKLYFNISQSRSSYESNPSTKPECMTLSLEYACLHWAHHVAISSTPELDTKIDQIFRPKLLFWLELLSVIRKVGLAAGLLRIAASAVSVPPQFVFLLNLPQVKEPMISQFLRDANFFVASSREAIERSAAHIYLSALTFADPDSLVYKQFASHCSGLVTVEKLGIGPHGGGTVMTLTGHGGAVRSVAYSCDGLLLASGSEDGTVRVWDTRTGEEAMSSLLSGDGMVLSVDFARNNQRIASGTEAGIVCIWDVTTGRAKCQKLSGHSDAVKTVKFSPDGSCLASGSKDKAVHLWNPETGEKLAVLSGHENRINGVAFSPDGDILASIGTRNEMFLWHVSTGTAAGKMKGAGYDSVDFSPDGKLMAEAANNVVTLRQYSTKNYIGLLHGSAKIRHASFSPDSRALVATHGNGLRLWTLESNPLKSPWVDLTGHSGAVRWATFSPCGMYIASASDDCTVRIWSTGSGQSVVQQLVAHEKAVSSVAVSPNGNFIFSGSADHSVRVWNARTGEATLPPLGGHTNDVRSVSVSPDGLWIASASDDGTVRLWDAHSGAAVGEPMKCHTDWVRALSFSNNSRWLASASDDKTVLMWDIATQQPLTIGPLRCTSLVFTVVFSPDNELIAAGDGGGRIYLWRAVTGEQVCEPWQANAKAINSLAFSPNGKKVVSGGNDNKARIWDVSTSQPIHVLEGHTDSVLSVAWSSDGGLIGTGSEDHTVRLWDAMTGVSLATLRGHIEEVRSVAFTGDGQYLVSGSGDTTIRKWDVDAACRQVSESVADPVAVLASGNLKDGWLVGPSGELLLWVPAEYRVYLQAGIYALTIGKSRVIVTVGAGGLHAGPNWKLCWRD